MTTIEIRRTVIGKETKIRIQQDFLQRQDVCWDMFCGIGKIWNGSNWEEGIYIRRQGEGEKVLESDLQEGDVENTLDGKVWNGKDWEEGVYIKRQGRERKILEADLQKGDIYPCFMGRDVWNGVTWEKGIYIERRGDDTLVLVSDLQKDDLCRGANESFCEAYSMWNGLFWEQGIQVKEIKGKTYWVLASELQKGDFCAGFSSFLVSELQERDFYGDFNRRVCELYDVWNGAGWIPYSTAGKQILGSGLQEEKVDKNSDEEICVNDDVQFEIRREGNDISVSFSELQKEDVCLDEKLCEIGSMWNGLYWEKGVVVCRDDVGSRKVLESDLQKGDICCGKKNCCLSEVDMCLWNGKEWGEGFKIEREGKSYKMSESDLQRRDILCIDNISCASYVKEGMFLGWKKPGTIMHIWNGDDWEQGIWVNKKGQERWLELMLESDLQKGDASCREYNVDIRYSNEELCKEYGVWNGTDWEQGIDVINYWENHDIGSNRGIVAKSDLQKGDFCLNVDFNKEVCPIASMWNGSNWNTAFFVDRGERKMIRISESDLEEGDICSEGMFCEKGSVWDGQEWILGDNQLQNDLGVEL